jgi:hypothetical protein
MIEHCLRTILAGYDTDGRDRRHPHLPRSWPHRCAYGGGHDAPVQRPASSPSPTWGSSAAAKGHSPARGRGRIAPAWALMSGPSWCPVSATLTTHLSRLILLASRVGSPHLFGSTGSTCLLTPRPGLRRLASPFPSGRDSSALCWRWAFMGERVNAARSDCSVLNAPRAAMPACAVLLPCEAPPSNPRLSPPTSGDISVSERFLCTVQALAPFGRAPMRAGTGR